MKKFLRMQMNMYDLEKSYEKMLKLLYLDLSTNETLLYYIT